MRTVDTRQTKNLVADAIRNEILAGKLKPGEELTQEKLAEALEVSRMPIREALYILETEGFLERLSNRHMRVAILNEENIREVFQVVAALEAEMASIINNKKDVQSELKLYEERFQNNSENEAGSNEVMFHRWIGNKMENSYLLPTYEKLLQGYITYAILELKREMPIFQRLLLQFIKEMQNQESAGELRRSLNSYYDKLADVMVEHFEKEIFEK